MEPKQSAIKGVLSRLLPLLVVLFVSWGCAGAMGRLTTDVDVTRMFTSHSLPDTYRYYYTGSSDYTMAIIGLHPEYALVADSAWKPVQPDSDEFLGLVSRMYGVMNGTTRMPATGKRILDHRRKPIGIWYSSYSHTYLHIDSQQQVTISAPLGRSVLY